MNNHEKEREREREEMEKITHKCQHICLNTQKHSMFYYYSNLTLLQVQ